MAVGGSRDGDTAPVALRGGGCGRVMPNAKTSEEGELIAAETGVFRQALQFERVTPADDHIIGFKDGAQLGDDVVDYPPPFLTAQPFETSIADVFLVRAPVLVRQMCEFH